MMTERDLAFYLKGFFELKGDTKMTKGQQDKIRSRIDLVRSHGDSAFVDHIEAVIDTPSAVSRIVDTYFKSEVTEEGSKGFFLAEKFRKIQTDFARFGQELFSDN